MRNAHDTPTRTTEEDKMFETTDFTEFKAQMKARGFRFAPSYSAYPGDDGDLNSEVVDGDNEMVGHWGPTDEGFYGEGIYFSGVLADNAEEFARWNYMDDEEWAEMADACDNARVMADKVGT